MKNFTRWMLTGSLAALCTVALTTASLAQQQRQEREQQERQTQARQGRQGQQQAKLTEQDLVHWVLLDNLAEIQIAQFAQQKAQNPQVKQFAQKMVQEHQELVQKLRQIAPDIQLPQLAAQAGQQQGERRAAFRPEEQEQQQQQRGRQDSGISSAPLPVSPQQLREALAQKYLSSAIETLQQQQQGEEFDKAFMGGQVMMHALATDNLQVFQQIAQTSGLKQTLQQAEQATMQHQREAKQIFEQIDRGGQQGQQRQQSQQRQQRQQQN